MSSVDNRVVQMKFDNKQFESGVKTTISSLDRLKNSLNMDSAARSLSKIESYSKTFSSSVSSSVYGIADRFSALGIIGSTVLSNLTTSAMNMASKISNMVISPIISGGKSRALNIEQAKFQLQGLNIEWEDIEEDISYGVQDTAYGLDSAAKAASQLVASGVQLGDEMKSALRGISGVAAMTNSEYDDISRIFTTIAGNGRLMSDQLNQLGSRGLNAAATLAKALGVTEQEVREMTSKGQIDFKTFSDAMDSAYGEHAKDANKTFTGALSNMKAAMSRIGAKFATPAFENLKNVMNALIPVINAINKGLDPLVDIATKGMEKISQFAIDSLNGLGKTAKKEVKNLEAFAEIAKKVINGDFGNGAERKKQLEALGYSYEDVQAKVNSLLGATNDLSDASVEVPSFDTLISIIGNFIKSIKNVGSGAVGILGTLNKAFKEVFPPTTLEDVNSFMKKTEELTSKFKITDKEAGKLKSAFKGLFAIFDIGKESISAVRRVLLPLTDNFSGFGDKITDIAAKLGDYIFKIDDTIKKNDKFYETLNKISDYVKSDFKDILPKVEEFYGSFCELIKPLTDELSNAKDSLAVFAEKGLGKDKLNRISTFGDILKYLVESVLNVGTAVMKVAKPISEAFSEVFKPIQLKTVSSLAKRLSEFTSSLKISDKTAEKVKSTFKGLFAAADIVKQIFSALIRTIFPTSEHFGKLGDGILTVTSFLGEHIAEIDKTIRENDTFYNVLQKVIEFIKTGFDTAKTKVSEFAEKYEELTGKKLQMPTFEDFFGFIDKLKEKFSWVPDFIGKIKDSFSDFFSSFSEDEAGNKAKAIENIINVLDKLSDMISDVSPGIGEFLSEIGESFDKIDFDRMGKIVNIALLVVLIRTVQKLKSVMSTLGSFGRPLHNLNGVLVSTKGALTAFTNNIKSNTLITTASAIALLAAALIGLSMVKEERLTSALGAMTTLFVELFGSMLLMDKLIEGKNSDSLMKMSFSLILIATAISILASAMAKLGGLDNEQLMKGLIGISVLIIGLYGFLKATDFEKLSISQGVGLVLIAVALNMMAATVKKLGKIDVVPLIKGLIGLAALLAAIAAFTNFVGNPTKLVSTGIGLNIIAAAMIIFSKAVAVLGSLSLADLAKGLGGMAVALAEIFLACMFMPASLPLLSVGLVTVALALNLLSFALKTMGSMSWNELARSLLLLTGSLTAITVSMIFMKSALPGAAALLVVAASLAILAPILTMLGKMSLAEIGKSLLVLAGAFLVIGAAAALLSPVIPSMLGLAGSITLLGIAFLGLGVGMAALSIGIAALSASSVGITVFIYSLGQAIVALVDSLVVIGMSLLNGIDALALKIVEVTVRIVVCLVQTLVQYVPLIVEGGMMLILGILQGIDNNIDKITISALSIIVKFINGIAIMLPDIIQAGINLMVNFIDGMADGIRDNTEKILSAIQNLMSAIVEFALSTLQQLVRNIPVVGQEMVDGLEDAKSAVRDALSPKEMETIGSDAATATASGIEWGKEKIQDAGKGLGRNAKDGLSSVLDGFGSLGTDFGTNFSSALGDTNDMASFAGLDLGNSAASGLDSVLGDFGSMGTDFGMDFSSALGDTSEFASSAANGLGETASDGLNLDFSDLGELSGDTYVS
ncbi:MAG: tape measure protein, partial [Clostridia bacterium]|nr:tape measure protein [Clostridia bacterium]